MKYLAACLIGLLFTFIPVDKVPASDEVNKCSTWMLMETQDKQLFYHGYKNAVIVAYNLAKLKDESIALFLDNHMRPPYTSGNQMLDYMDSYCERYPNNDFAEGLIFFLNKKNPW